MYYLNFQVTAPCIEKIRSKIFPICWIMGCHWTLRHFFYYYKSWNGKRYPFANVKMSQRFNWKTLQTCTCTVNYFWLNMPYPNSKKFYHINCQNIFTFSVFAISTFIIVEKKGFLYCNIAAFEEEPFHFQKYHYLASLKQVHVTGIPRFLLFPLAQFFAESFWFLPYVWFGWILYIPLP